MHEAMDGERGNDMTMRVNAMLWKEKARAASEDCGSSSKNLDRLIEFLRAEYDDSAS